MKPAVVRSTLAFSAIVLALSGCLQDGGAISPSHAGNASMAPAVAPAAAPVTANRYGLPDFSGLVEQVGPAVVNISVTQKRARPGATSGDDPFAGDPFYDLRRRFGLLRVGKRLFRRDQVSRQVEGIGDQCRDDRRADHGRDEDRILALVDDVVREAEQR